jgi:hypothetical protein
LCSSLGPRRCQVSREHSRPVLVVSSHPVNNALTGKPADNDRHAIVRAAFLNEFLNHEELRKMFIEWGQRSGLKKAVKHAASTRDVLATALGLEARHQLLFADLGAALARALGGERIEGETLVGAQDQKVARRRFQRLKRLLSAAESAQQNVRRKLARERYTPQAIGLVRKLVSPCWPWLAYEVIAHFCDRTLALVFGSRIVNRHWVEQREPFAPHVTLHFETRDEETLSEASERLTRAVAETARELHARSPRGEPPRGRFTMMKKPQVEEYARWFYRNRVLGVSQRALAREYCERHHRGAILRNGHDFIEDRSTIRRGIYEAERLGLGAYGWK